MIHEVRQIGDNIYLFFIDDKTCNRIEFINNYDFYTKIVFTCLKNEPLFTFRNLHLIDHTIDLVFDFSQVNNIHILDIHNNIIESHENINIKS